MTKKSKKQAEVETEAVVEAVAEPELIGEEIAEILIKNEEFRLCRDEGSKGLDAEKRQKLVSEISSMTDLEQAKAAIAKIS